MKQSNPSLITLTNAKGQRFFLTTLGASLIGAEVADRNGRVADVICGLADPACYRDNPCYFGSTVGPVANRLTAGKVRLGNRLYRLPLNEGRNCLHSGPQGFHTKDWTLLSQTESQAVLTLFVPAGENNLPGPVRLTLTVSWTYNLEKQRSEADLVYRAESDALTALNLTTHSYFNLNPERQNILDHCLQLASDYYLPTDAENLPTGALQPVAGTPFDFTSEHPLRDMFAKKDPQIAKVGGLDHNFVLRGDGRRTSSDSRSDAAEPSHLDPPPVWPAAILADPVTGRRLTLLTNQPGLQVYTGNSLDGSDRRGKFGPYPAHSAIALEAQAFPDAPNHPGFGDISLRPGQLYFNRVIYRFDCF